MPLLDVDGLTLCAHGKRILDGVSFRIERGETFALVGESGSGKSMTSLAIMRLLPTGITVSEGDIRFEKMSLFACTEREMCRIRGKRIAMIFQEPMNALNPVRRIGDQIDEAVRLHTSAVGDEVKRATLRLLEEVGMTPPDSYYSRFPHQLSGGQKQRVMIAMALAGDPELLIADEPTTALDVTVQAQILRLLRRVGKERMLSVLFITHDLAVVAQVAHRIGVLKKGKLVEVVSTEKFFRAPSHPYSISLLRHVKGVSNTMRTAEKRDVLIEIKGLRVVYERRHGWWRRAIRTEALKGIDLYVREGETLALVGESGSGKSTVAKAIVGLTSVVSGDLFFEGDRVNRRNRDFRRKVQLVFQDPFASLNPRMRIVEIIAEGMEATGMYVPDKESYIKSVLREVELDSDALHRYPHAFSGGQRQRIAIARALAVSPRFLILDEPTSALDVTTRGEILTLLKRLQESKGLSYLFITHDLALVSAFAHRVAVMREGDIVEEGDTTTLMRYPQHPYTKTLLQSVPKIPRYER